MKSIFFLIIFNLSLFAVDVSSFDIKGIKFGDSISIVTNSLSKKGYTCEKLYKSRFYEEDGMTTFGVPEFYELWCDKGENESINIRFNHNKEVMNIYRSIEYTGIIPNFSKINYKIINKYGNPRYKEKCTSSHGNTHSTYIGWGDIYIQYNKTFECNELETDNNAALIISYTKRKDNTGMIQFYFYDNNKIKENKRWIEKYRKKYLKNKKKQLENIDL